MRLPRVLKTLAAALGPPLAGWGGYGLGVGAAGPLFTGPNALAACLLVAGCGAGGAAAVALLRGRREDDSVTQTRRTNFAADAAVLEALAPAVAGHPRGLGCLKALAELLFEVHHPAAPVAPAADVTDAEGGVR